MHYPQRLFSVSFGHMAACKMRLSSSIDETVRCLIDVRTFIATGTPGSGAGSVSNALTGSRFNNNLYRVLNFYEEFFVMFR